MLNRGITVSSVTSYFRAARPQSVTQGPTQQEVTNALTPLFDYFNENFAIMKETLTDSAMVMVMTRLWKEVLATVESLLVPPLSDKLSQQRQLTQQELDIVFKWLKVGTFDPSGAFMAMADNISFCSIFSTPQTKKGTPTVSLWISSNPQNITNSKI